MGLSMARTEILARIERGDVIFGIAAGGQEKIMLVYQSDPARILARHVTSQVMVEFGRDGVSREIGGGGTCTILSAAPLPPHEYSVLVGLDRKMRLAQFPDGFRLSQDEQRLLLEMGTYFRSNPLPTE